MNLVWRGSMGEAVGGKIGGAYGNEIRGWSLKSQIFIDAYRTPAQMGEHAGMVRTGIAKVGVEGSNPFARSSFLKDLDRFILPPRSPDALQDSRASSRSALR
jgi:hypothetical protein